MRRDERIVFRAEGTAQASPTVMLFVSVTTTSAVNDERVKA
jgi:hypothetical protein